MAPLAELLDTPSACDRASMLCPSARCTENAQLIGRAISPVEVAILQVPITVTRAFVEEAKQRRPPEKRFRFAAPCKGENCANWQDNRCQVPSQVSTLVEQVAAPACGIREQCRWFHENDWTACRVCPKVTTERDV